MYETRFGLHRKPFQTVSSNGEFFRSESFEELCPVVLHALRSDLGMSILTGPAGSGKSTTLEYFRRTLSTSSQTVLLRGGSVASMADLLQALHRQLNSNAVSESDGTSGVQRWNIVDRLQRVAEFWGPLIVMIDDAHLLQAETFAELRTLQEEQGDGQKLIRVMLAGPLNLEETLAQPSMVDFAQKIRCHAFLRTLRTSESVQFLKHQIEICGGQASQVFDGPALEIIVAAADGLPRNLNLLADECLMICEENDHAQVTAYVVETALQRLQHLPVAWNYTPRSTDHDDADTGEVDETHRFESDLSDRPHSTSQPMQAADSVIEIGGPAVTDSASVVEVTQHRSSIVEIASPVENESSRSSVIEIGGPSARQPVDTAADSIPPHAESLHHDEPLEDQTAIEVESAFGNADSDHAKPDYELDEDSDVFEVGGVECDEPETAEVNTQRDEPSDVEHAAAVDEGIEARLNRLLDDVTSTTDADEAELTTTSLTDVDWNDLPLDETTKALITEDDGPADLAHHLLLSTHHEIQPVESTDAAGLETDSEAGFERTDPSPDLQDFPRWTPAGRWPSEVKLSWTDQEPAEPVEQEIPLQKAAGAEQSADFLSAQDANRISVFDRYTWQELGRAVAPDTGSRRPMLAVDRPAVAAWPPTTEGIAPRRVIPISVLSAEEQTSLQPVIEQQPDEAFADAPLPEPSVAEHADFDQDPELTIDQIQQLLHTEIFDAVETETTWQSQQTEHASNDDLITSDLPEDEEEAVAKIGNEDFATDDVPLDLNSLTDVVSLPVYDPQATEAEDDSVEDYTSTEASIIEAQLQTDNVEAQVDSAQIQTDYRPHLLDDARALVLEFERSRDEAEATDDHDEILRSPLIPIEEASDLIYSQPPAEFGTGEPTARRPNPVEASNVETASVQDEAETTIDKSANRFRTLFTRLRQMKNRSA